MAALESTLDVVNLCECGCGQPTPERSAANRHRGSTRFIHGHNRRGHQNTSEARRKVSLAKTGKKRPEITGPNSRQWKGEDVSYIGIHAWLRRHKVKAGICSQCGAERKTQWSNISGEYRRDFVDFDELCVPCHKRRDLGRRDAVSV